MRKARLNLVAFVVGAFTLVPVVATSQEKQPNLNILLMEATFRIEGQTTQARPVIGTAFLMARPYSDNPKRGRIVLVTAAHVLQEIAGEKATIVMRKKTGPSSWERFPVSIRIRSAELPLWTKHPDADVAVMYVHVPSGTVPDLVPTTMLADDEMLAKYGITTGEEMNCLGYPLGAESSAAGFAILRSGKIASYPLLPSVNTKVFLLDFEVFKGNSGGPVYFYLSGGFIGNKMFGRPVQFIMGLVSGEKRHRQLVQELYSERVQDYPLAVAEVVHASLIRQAIQLLPPPEEVP